MPWLRWLDTVWFDLKYLDGVSMVGLAKELAVW
jgi:hypothetical protein